MTQIERIIQGMLIIQMINPDAKIKTEQGWITAELVSLEGWDQRLYHLGWRALYDNHKILLIFPTQDYML